MKRFLGVAVWFLCLNAMAQPYRLWSGPDFQPGKDYIVLDRVIETSDPRKIEVRDMFVYTCPHCHLFLPVAEPWAKALGHDIDYVKTPVVFSRNLINLARLYYTLKLLNRMDIHPLIFDAIHNQKKPLNKMPAMRAFLVRQGIEADDFERVFNSDEVSALLKQGDQAARGAQVTGTPQLVIDGRYRIEADPRGHAIMLQKADYLINKRRLERLYGEASSP